LAVSGNEKKVCIANETAWLPYYGKDLKDGGVITDIVRYAFKSEGYEIEVLWYPWKRALREVENGNCDALGGAFYTKGRAEVYNFSDPFWKTKQAFFKLKKRKISFGKLEDLKPYIIGIGRGYGLPESVENAKYLKFDEADNTSTNIRKLIFGRIDLIVDTIDHVHFRLDREFAEHKEKVQILGKPIDEDNLHVAFSKKIGMEKLKAFNRGLKKIKADGTFKKLLKKHGFQKREF